MYQFQTETRPARIKGYVLNPFPLLSEKVLLQLRVIESYVEDFRSQSNDSRCFKFCEYIMPLHHYGGGIVSCHGIQFLWKCLKFEQEIAVTRVKTGMLFNVWKALS